MAATAGLASALGIVMIAGVDVENNLSHEQLVGLSTTSNYVDFWQKFHGVRNEGGHYLLSLPLAEKPISLIKANHRGRTLLKREFKKSVTEDAESVMRHLVL